MNLSWFDDWRFDLRQWAAFHETRLRVSQVAKGAIIKEASAHLHGK